MIYSTSLNLVQNSAQVTTTLFSIYQAHIGVQSNAISPGIKYTPSQQGRANTGWTPTDPPEPKSVVARCHTKAERFVGNIV